VGGSCVQTRTEIKSRVCINVTSQPQYMGLRIDYTVENTQVERQVLGKSNRPGDDDDVWWNSSSWSAEPASAPLTGSAPPYQNKRLHSPAEEYRAQRDDERNRSVVRCF